MLFVTCLLYLYGTIMNGINHFMDTTCKEHEKCDELP